jgi:hypothetical protein
MPNTCPRCTKTVSEGAHTCTPTPFVRKIEADRDAALAMVRELVELCRPLAHFVSIYEHMGGLNQETVYGCTNSHGSADIDVENLKAIRKAVTKAEALNG